MMRPPPEPPGHASRSGAIPLALERTKSAHLALLPLFSCELRRLSDLEKVTHGGTPTGGAPEATEPLDLAPPWLGGGQGHGLWRPDRPYRRAPSSSCPPSSRSPQLARSNSEQIMASPGTAIGRTTQILTPNNDPVPNSNGQCDLGPLMECRYERNSRMSWRVVVINKIASVANILASQSIIPFGMTI